MTVFEASEKKLVTVGQSGRKKAEGQGACEHTRGHQLFHSGLRTTAHTRPLVLA
jgi:hypothetical protein